MEDEIRHCTLLLDFSNIHNHRLFIFQGFETLFPEAHFFAPPGWLSGEACEKSSRWLWKEKLC